MDENANFDKSGKWENRIGGFVLGVLFMFIIRLLEAYGIIY